MKMLYVDVETTGLDWEEHDIIQLSGSLSVFRHREDFDLLMRPAGDYQLNESAYQCHKKTREEIDSYPSSSEIFNKFMGMLKKHVNKYDKTDKFFFIGYNSTFDMNFVRAWFEKNDEEFFHSFFHFPSLDVMQAAAFHLMGKRAQMDNFRLDTVYKELTGKTLEKAHDAMADINATKEILTKIVEQQGRL